MKLTQTDINKTLNSLINECTGKRVAHPDGSYPGECSSPVVLWFAKMGIPHPSMAHNRADGWGVNFPHELSKYFVHHEFSSNATYPKGSIVMWNSPHIAILTEAYKGGNKMEVFEQNADPDGSVCGIKSRTVDTSKRSCSYVLTFKMNQDTVVHPYTIKKIDPKQVRLTKDTKKYGLKYDNWTAIEANNLGSAHKGRIITVRAIAHHTAVGKDFYLEDPAVTQGYLKSACEDYSAPKKKPEPPQGAIPLPTSKEQYTIVTTMFGFTTSNNAVNRRSAVGTVSPGKYYVFNVRKGIGDSVIAINVTKVLGKPGSWINPSDNVLEKEEPEEVAPVPETPVPEPAETVAVTLNPESQEVVIPEVKPLTITKWQNTEQPLLPNFDPVRVVTNNDEAVKVHDLAGENDDITLEALTPVHIVSSFTKDGVTYARAEKVRNANLWYGIPWELVVDNTPALNFADAVGHMLYKMKLLIQDVRKW